MFFKPRKHRVVKTSFERNPTGHALATSRRRTRSSKTSTERFCPGSPVKRWKLWIELSWSFPQILANELQWRRANMLAHQVWTEHGTDGERSKRSDGWMGCFMSCFHVMFIFNEKKQQKSWEGAFGAN